MTDNGPCFYADLFRDTCRALDLRHLRTPIYTPRTNGKAERFIQSAIREWAFARLYQNSQLWRVFVNPGPSSSQISADSGQRSGAGDFESPLRKTALYCTGTHESE
jgi:transposase InsO family protein